MATFLLTTGVGAILNAATFIGGSYLAKFLSGKDQDEDRKRHDLAVEKYEKDYNAWKEKMDKLQAWKEQEKKEGDASHKFRNTDEALKVYAASHPGEDFNLEEPRLSSYYTPSKDQKNGEMLFTGLTVAGVAYGVSKGW